MKVRTPSHPLKEVVMRSARGPVGCVILALLIGGAPLLGGCGSSTQRAEGPDVGASPSAATATQDEPIPDGPTSPPAATATPPQPTPPQPTRDEPVLSDLAAMAVDDLTQRLGIEPAAVKVIAEKEVTWNDGSLGCEQRGMMYTQALVDGSRVTLRVDGVDYHYHSRASREPFLCEKPTE